MWSKQQSANNTDEAKVDAPRRETENPLSELRLHHFSDDSMQTEEADQDTLELHAIANQPSITGICPQPHVPTTWDTQPHTSHPRQ